MTREIPAPVTKKAGKSHVPHVASGMTQNKDGKVGIVKDSLPRTAQTSTSIPSAPIPISAPTEVPSIQEIHSDKNVVSSTDIPSKRVELHSKELEVTEIFSTSVPEAQDELDDQNLVLHNSFDIINHDKEMDPGEALLEDMDVLEVSNSLDAIVDNTKNAYDEIASSVPTFDGQTDEHLEMIVGRQSFPVIPLSLSLQDDTTGRLSFPSVIPASSSKVVDPVLLQAWVNTPVITPLDAPNNRLSVKVTLDNTFHPSMPQPVTTRYDSLTSDNLPSNQNLVLASKSSLHSAATLKSVQILSKLWGDEVEEEGNDEAIPSIFEQHYPSLSESTKAERKQKKLVNKVKPTSFNSAEMRTRVQKGTSKADLAYDE